MAGPVRSLLEVDHGGAVPKQPCGSVHDVKQYIDRGWGEVAEGSYHGFLLWLEKVFNGQGYNPAGWRQFVPASQASDTSTAEALAPAWPWRRRACRPKTTKGLSAMKPVCMGRFVMNAPQDALLGRIVTLCYGLDKNSKTVDHHRIGSRVA